MRGTALKAEPAGPLGSAPSIVTTPPGPKARALVARDHAVGSPSSGRPYPLVVRRAQGSTVEDVDGNRYIDFVAGIAVCSTGHCHPKVVAAIEKQARDLIHICGSDFYYEAQTGLAEALIRITPGNEPKRVLLTNSGAETVEAAIKLSRHHTKRKGVIAFYGAFHGRTMGALSLTASKSRQKEYFAPLVPLVEHVPYGDIDAIRKHVFKQIMAPDEVAAIFVEPIQGEGGYVIPPPSFLPELRSLCDQHGILLVADEIQSGMGRTGKMFCVDHYGVVPDITLIAKGVASGMPIGALVARAAVMDWPVGAQGSTFGGNPVCCAAALATIELLEQELIANVNRVSPIARERLARIAAENACIANPRGLGLMLAIDVVKADGGPDQHKQNLIVTEAFKRGLLTLQCGECGIRITPPLCITPDQLGAGLDTFAEAIAAAG